MSAAGYDASHVPSSFSRPEQRRSSGTFPSSYDRPLNAPLRRSSPSPGVSRRSTDTYMPPRSEYPYRDGLSNVYRPSNYRPDYSNSYYSRSPSPDSYGHRSRLSEPEVWDRGSSWRPPPVEAPNGWPDRKIVPPSPTTSSRGRGTREESNRMFEPSDSWKQSHNDRSPRIDHSPPSDHRYDRHSRNSMEVSPDRPARNNRPPAFIPGGDHYRPPHPKRDTYPPARSDYDSYRPPSDSHWSHWNSRYDPISPASSHHRRDSGSISFGRNSDRYESPYPPSRAVSGKASMSPRPVISPMTSSPSWSTPHREPEPWSYLPPASKPDLPSRAPSRSSIASTQVSDRRSPAPPPIPPPPNSIVEPPVVLRDAPAEQNGSEKKIEETKPEAKKVTSGNSAIPTATFASLPETHSAPNPAPPVPVAVASADVFVTKQSHNHSTKFIFASQIHLPKRLFRPQK
ncbi:hypothetical protein CPB84DRAFT_149696 [Gymnopilus junonius]|uniref:Uncharacterized protein n=1 Tax=Gymnopilus junonius TaxID=109634 RepID=A0A9P5TII0_GYMJU|nr:hypothetical protein CPB84DRAFT_149696 [Gymnopilus junonius]